MLTLNKMLLVDTLLVTTQFSGVTGENKGVRLCLDYSVLDYLLCRQTMIFAYKLN